MWLLLEPYKVKKPVGFTGLLSFLLLCITIPNRRGFLISLDSVRWVFCATWCGSSHSCSASSWELSWGWNVQNDLSCLRSLSLWPYHSGMRPSFCPGQQLGPKREHSERASLRVQVLSGLCLH